MATDKLDTSTTAQELVASFKTMSYSRQEPPSPPPSPQRQRELDDDAFTLIDCMSIFFGSGDSTGTERDCCSWHEVEEMRLDLHAAMNTISGSSSVGGCGHRKDTDSAVRHRQQNSGYSRYRCGQHHRSPSGHHHQPQQHHLKASCKVRVSPAEESAEDDKSRDSSRRRRDRRRHRRGDNGRRCFHRSERVSDDPPIVEEAASATSPPLERALTGIQPADANCLLFLCTSCPQTRWTQRASCLPELPSRSATSTPSHSSRQWRRPRPSPLLPLAPQQLTPQACQRQRKSRVGISAFGGGEASGEWPRRGASSNCNAEGSSNVVHTRAPYRRRSVWRRRRSPDGDQVEEGDADSAEESSIYISASTASPRAQSAPKPWRHLLEPPIPSCHRVWVPAGADAGRPPRKPHRGSAIGGLTRSAARTARSVSRHLRAALCSGRRRVLDSAAFAGGDNSGGGMAYIPPASPPLPSVMIRPPTPPPSFPTRRRPDANNNRNAGGGFESSRSGGNGGGGGGGGDFSSLLRTLERAQLRQEQRRRRHCPSPSTSVELLVDDSATKYMPPVSVSASATSSPTTSPAEAENSCCDSAMASGTSTASSSSLAAASVVGAAPVFSRSQPPRRRLKADMINTMSASLIQLEQSLQGCVGCIHGTLFQLRRDASRK